MIGRFQFYTQIIPTFIMIGISFHINNLILIVCVVNNPFTKQLQNKGDL
jgi:ABC-type transporter lipoprotein component MlaA